jgi:HEAT repeat protein
MRTCTVRSKQSRGLLATILAIALPSQVPALAGPVPAESVEELRLLLKAPVTDVSRRERAVSEQLKLVDGINDLRRAVALREWRDEDPDDRIAAVDRRNREVVAKRFAQAAREVLRQGDATSRLAMLSMLGKMGTSVRAVGTASGFASMFAVDLAALIKQGDSHVREAAARALGLINPDPAVAVPALGGLLRAREVSLRIAAADSLVSLIRVESNLASRNRLADAVEATRADMVRMGCAVVPLAARGLGDADPRVRRRSMEALGQTADGLQKLVVATRAADEPDEPGNSRRQIEEERDELLPLIRALRDQGPALTRGLGDADPDVRLMARQALEDMTNPQLQLLQRAASVDTHGTTGTPVALRPSQFINPPSQPDALLEGLQKTVQVLAAGLSDPDVRARRGAVDVLEALGPASAAAARELVRALHDTDQFVRWAAARTLGKISPVASKTAVPALGELLADLDLDVRMAAAMALECYGPAAKPALPMLIRATRATDAELRVTAMRSVSAVGSAAAPAAVPALTEALADTDDRVRQMAAQVLGHFGPAAREAVAALNLALQDSNPDVQKAAGEALLNIKRPSKK